MRGTIDLATDDLGRPQLWAKRRLASAAALHAPPVPTLATRSARERPAAIRMLPSLSQPQPAHDNAVETSIINEATKSLGNTNTGILKKFGRAFIGSSAVGPSAWAQTRRR